MPIYDIGYQPWDGEREPVSRRWMPITRTGIRLAWQSKALRRLIWMAWMPVTYFLLFFFAVGWVTDAGNAGTRASSMFHGIVFLMFGEQAMNQLIAAPETMRPVAWSIAFFVFFSFTQGFLSLLVVSIVGPPLISRDLRHKAYLVYFSKPIPVWCYIVGKLGVLAFYIALITLVPATLLYALSIVFSPSLGAVVDTAPVLLRIVGASLVLIIPISLLVLYLSSISENERVASFAWLMVFIFGMLIHNVAAGTPGYQDTGYLFLVSPLHTGMVVVGGVFDVRGQLASIGLEGSFKWLWVGNYGRDEAMVGGVFLLVLSLLCIRGIANRVTAPVRI